MLENIRELRGVLQISAITSTDKLRKVITVHCNMRVMESYYCLWQCGVLLLGDTVLEFTTG